MGPRELTTVSFLNLLKPIPSLCFGSNCFLLIYSFLPHCCTSQHQNPYSHCCLLEYTNALSFKLSINYFETFSLSGYHTRSNIFIPWTLIAVGTTVTLFNILYSFVIICDILGDHHYRPSSQSMLPTAGPN